jgi:hypothetical protein
MNRSFGILALTALSALLVLPGCGSGEEGPSSPNGAVDDTVQVSGSHPYSHHFEAAAKEFGVPASLLVAIGYAETRLYHVPGEA